MKRFNFLLIVFLTILLVSCNKSEDQATGAGDVLIVSKKSGLNTVYGISIYAYTYSSGFKSVNVVNAADATDSYTLKANQGFKTNFYYETPDAEYTETVPGAATYNFSAVFENGAIDEFQDVLTDKYLAVPTIDKCIYNSGISSFDITWEGVTGADTYAINIFDGSTLIFGGPQLSDAARSFSIRSDGSGWVAGNPPVNGKSYTVKVYAFMYELTNNTYDVQASAIAQINAVWGN